MTVLAAATPLLLESSGPRPHTATAGLCYEVRRTLKRPISSISPRSALSLSEDCRSRPPLPNEAKADRCRRARVRAKRALNEGYFPRTAKCGATGRRADAAGIRAKKAEKCTHIMHLNLPSQIQLDLFQKRKMSQSEISSSSSSPSSSA